MPMSKVFTTYLRDIESAFKAGNATEHTHRPALKALIEALRDKVIATNEPQRIACGAPDFIITQGEIPLGYIEAKDVGVDLDRAEETAQLKRYRLSLNNLILTDYLEFRLFRSDEKVQSVRIASPQKNGTLRFNADAATQLEILLQAFLDAKVPSVTDPKELAQRMARLAKLIDELIRQAFQSEAATGDLHAQYDAFQKVLISDLSVDQFADMYAQTIAYGLFAARCNHVGPNFRRELAGKELPKTNPFLRRLFNTIAGNDLDERISWAVDDLAELLARADMEAILADFGKQTRQHDPVVHFYETFLAAYDPKLRELRGVYYTPEPVVDYIVRSVDSILKGEFKLADGLADAGKVKLKRPKQKGRAEEPYETHRVQILDPACGTGTFLHAIVRGIHDGFSGNKGMWPSYVAEHLLPRLHGFELLMAPYAVAHMKLGIQLKESGYDFAAEERLRVYLTNTLEEAHELTGLPLFTQWLAEEAAAAGVVKKDVPIMVVLGNPPYSGHSANKGSWITGLLDEYKKSPELKKPAQAKWLSDDYVKFIRFAQWRIEQTGHGVLAFITNHSYLDNPTFLDMRASLMASFDQIHVLDLHGSSKKREKALDGTKDENVFDIQQGVAIAILIKRNAVSKNCVVQRADIWGLRTEKYDWLSANSVSTTGWEDVTPTAAPWLFVKQDAGLLAEYEQGWSVADIFKEDGDPAPGVVTTHDEFAISWSREEAVNKVERLLATVSESEARQSFTLCSQSQWNYARAKKELADGAWRHNVIPLLYRPFDVRWTVWDSNVCVHRRERVMRHLIGHENVGLVINRQVNGAFHHALVSSMVINDCTLSNKSKERSYILPLWLYADDDMFAAASPNRRPNVSIGFSQAVAQAIGRSPTPEEIFSYVYAVLSSPSYRVRYGEFLKRNFPRVPVPLEGSKFAILAAAGQELVDLHLMRSVAPNITTYPKAGSSFVEKIEFKPHAANAPTGAVFINEEQFFDGVPTAIWDHQVGGYQVALKWLKDRKGRHLTFDELKTYSNIIAILAETIRIQGQIDSNETL
jgi:predicted helicase